MKSISRVKSVFLVSLCSVFLTACLSDEPLLMPPSDLDPNDFLPIIALTRNPDLDTIPNVLKGSIIYNFDQEELEYGILWYNPHDPLSVKDPTPIVAGITTNESLLYSIEIPNNLPTGINLVAIAYAKHTSSNTISYFGERVPFTNR